MNDFYTPYIAKENEIFPGWMTVRSQKNGTAAWIC